jgi:hypothetical protein
MPKHLYLIILLTFITGLASGVYVYFTTLNSDEEKSVGTPIEEGYEVIAYTYGGCERVGCSSYKLADDGKYSYLMQSAGYGNERFNDTLSLKQHEELDAVIEDTNYKSIKESVFTGTCPDTYDGLAYRFEIRIENERYSFDSCTQSLEEKALFELLIKYFDIMNVTHSS